MYEELDTVFWVYGRDDRDHSSLRRSVGSMVKEEPTTDLMAIPTINLYTNVNMKSSCNDVCGTFNQGCTTLPSFTQKNPNTQAIITFNGGNVDTLSPLELALLSIACVDTSAVQSFTAHLLNLRLSLCSNSCSSLPTIQPFLCVCTALPSSKPTVIRTFIPSKTLTATPSTRIPTAKPSTRNSLITYGLEVFRRTGCKSAPESCSTCGFTMKPTVDPTVDPTVEPPTIVSPPF
eukprot:gene8004-10847_t